MGRDGVVESGMSGPSVGAEDGGDVGGFDDAGCVGLVVGVRWIPNSSK